MTTAIVIVKSYKKNQSLPKKLEVQKLEKVNVSQNACNAVSDNLIFPLVTYASSLVWSVSMLDCTHPQKKPGYGPEMFNLIRATSEYPARNFRVNCTTTVVHSPQSVKRKLVCKCSATAVHSPAVSECEID